MKTQMKFQKILSLVTLVIAACTFVLGICYCSGVINKSRYYTTDILGWKDSTTQLIRQDVIGADALYNYTQSATNVLVIMGIIYIVLVAFLYITNTNKRRNYYITNYIAIGIVCVYALAIAIVFFVVSGKSAAYANQIDYDLWYEYYEVCATDRYGNVSYTNPRYYSESRLTIILGFVLGVVVLADIAAWVLNLIWKIKLMQGEKALLAQGTAVETMEVA